MQHSPKASLTDDDGLLAGLEGHGNGVDGSLELGLGLDGERGGSEGGGAEAHGSHAGRRRDGRAHGHAALARHRSLQVHKHANHTIAATARLPGSNASAPPGAAPRAIAAHQKTLPVQQ